MYPTAIGSEPDHPGFDTRPLWQQVIVGNGIANGTFMVAVNRIGTETIDDTSLTFYGSSFVSDPYGRILVQAPRDEPAVLVADLDLGSTCRLVAPVPVPRHPSARHLRVAVRSEHDRLTGHHGELEPLQQRRCRDGLASRGEAEAGADPGAHRVGSTRVGERDRAVALRQSSPVRAQHQRYVCVDR